MSGKQLIQTCTAGQSDVSASGCARAANSISLVLRYRLNIEFILNENTFKMAITSVIMDTEVEMLKERGRLVGSCCFCHGILRTYKVFSFNLLPAALCLPLISDS